MHGISWTDVLSISEEQMYCSDCMDAQVDPCLCCSHATKSVFFTSRPICGLVADMSVSYGADNTEQVHILIYSSTVHII